MGSPSRRCAAQDANVPALPQEARSRRADARCTLGQRSLEASIPLLVLHADGLVRKTMRQMPYSSKYSNVP